MGVLKVLVTRDLRLLFNWLLQIFHGRQLSAPWIIPLLFTANRYWFTFFNLTCLFDPRVASAESWPAKLWRLQVELRQSPCFLTKTPQQEKKWIKEIGPTRSTDLAASDEDKFTPGAPPRSYYEKQRWLTGCGVGNAFYCFPCLQFQSVGTEVKWTTTWVWDRKHL